MIDLDFYEQEIEEKEKKIKELEKEIESLEEDKAEYIQENCNYKEDKKCNYFDNEWDEGNCNDCASHLSIGQIKR